MTSVGEVAQKVRSKNAGPFWLTVDIFCGTAEAYETISANVSTSAVAKVFAQPESAIKRFDIPDIHVVKFSLPRPIIQGSRFDRDMHGSQWGWLVSEMELDREAA
jgi:hypothetical protein